MRCTMAKKYVQYIWCEYVRLLLKRLGGNYQKEK